MMIKKLILFISLVAVSLSITACQDKNTQQESTQSSFSKSSSAAVLPKLKKGSTSTDTSDLKDSQTAESGYDNNEWMLMGYLVYKDKSTDNLQDTIQSIKNDFSKGDLSAHKKSASSYTLSNQYGSVDVEVDDDQVIVSNDGVTKTSKDELKKEFSGKEADIKSMTKYISSTTE